MKLFELILGTEDESGVFAISLVDKPAMESDFIAFKENLVEFKTVDEDKRLVTGIVLIPDKPIYRSNGDDGYYVYLSSDTIETASQMYLLQHNHSNATIEHAEEVKGLGLVESWIVTDPSNDKTNALGLSAEKGSWAATMKINNDDVWNNYVKTGKVNGFSIEAMFEQKPTNIEMGLIELLNEFKKNTSEY